MILNHRAIKPNYVAIKYWANTLLGLVIVGTSVTYFTERYKISFPTQGMGCLKANFYLIDTWDKKIERGELAAFKFPVEGNKFITYEQPFIKIIGAKSGDRVNQTLTHYSVNENKTQLDISMSSLERNDMTPEDVIKTFTVPNGMFFGVGETALSFDSRYWGMIPESKIMGQAYAIL